MNSGKDSASGTYLFIVPWDLDHPGGVNQVVINLYREFDKHGPFRPLVLVLDWHCRTPVEEVNAGCRAVRLRIRQAAGRHLRMRDLIAYLFTLPTTLRLLRQLLERYDVRVVNAHYPTLAFLNFVLLKKFGFYRHPLLVSFHGMDVHNANETHGLLKALWRWLARGSDSLIACSDSLVGEARALSPSETGNLLKVVNGVHSRAYLEAEARSAGAAPSRSRSYILNVATFEHKKGQDVLVRAFARLAADQPEIDLILIGGDGPTWESITTLVAALGLQHRVTCLKNLPHGEVIAYVEKAIIFAFPSRYEPLGIAMLEAAMFSVPVVASRVDGIPEVINSNEIGILVPAEDVVALEAALRKLLADGDLRAALGENLRQRVLREFTWHKAWETYVSLLGVGGSADDAPCLHDSTADA